jgi:hypothetical protein
VFLVLYQNRSRLARRRAWVASTSVAMPLVVAMSMLVAPSRWITLTWARAICPARRGNRKGVVEKANHTAAQRWWRTLEFVGWARAFEGGPDRAANWPAGSVKCLLDNACLASISPVVKSAR